MNAQVNTDGTAAPTAAPKPVRESETVKMADGREVEFAGAATANRAQKMKKESLFGESGNYLGTRFDFRDGRSIFFDVSKLPATLADGSGTYDSIGMLAAHGSEQKFGDAAAGSKGVVADMYDEVEGVIEQAYDGRWTKEREGGGGFAGTSILLRALVEQTGKPLDALKTWLKGKTKEQKDAMANHPQSPLKPIVERLRAEDAAKATNVDIGAQLAELDGIAA